MSITFGTLIIVFFLLPGLVFRRSFFVLPFDKRYAEVSTLSEIGIILITAVFVQWLGLFLAEVFIADWHRECLDVFGFIRTYVFSDPASEKCQAMFGRIDLQKFISYQFSLWGLAMMLGFLFNSIVRYFKLDRRYRIFRFGNSWYYYFSGEAIEFPDMGGNAKQIDYIFVDVLVRSDGKDLIYIGILSEYELSGNGGLKSFALKGAKRRSLGSESEQMSQEEKSLRTEEEALKEYYTIPSNILVIPYNENVININFRYYTDDQDDEGSSDNSSLLERFVQVISLAIIVIFFAKLATYLKRVFSKKNKPGKGKADSE